MRLALFSAPLCLLVALPAAAYTTAPVNNGGTIKGKITYNGKPPPPKTIMITKDPQVCGKTREDDVIEVDKSGGVKNVVVYLKDIQSGKPMDSDMAPKLDQKGCRYVPHTQIVPLGSTLQVTSSDPILHNVHSYLMGSTVINFAMPPAHGLVLRKKLTKAGGEQLKCDVHSFMTGGIFVADNPYHALTGEDGTFEIKDVPPGTYTIATWHQHAGPVTEKITVPAGGTADFNGKVR